MERRKSALCLTRGDIPKEEPIKKQALDLPEFFTSRSLSAKASLDSSFPSGVRTQNHEPLGILEKIELGLLFQSRLDLAGGRIFGKPCFRQLEKGKGAVSAQTFFVFLGGGNVEFFLELAHGDQGDAEHGKSPFVFSTVYHFRTGNAT